MTDQQPKDETAAGAPARKRDRGSAAQESDPSRLQSNAARDTARRLDPELSGRLTQIILPVVRDFSDAIIEAIGPVLMSYQDQLARLMVQHVEKILPAVQQEMEREAKQRVAQALETMRVEDAAPPPPTPKRRGRGQSDATQPKARSKRSTSTQSRDTQSTAPTRRETRPIERATQEQSEIPGGTEMTTETAQREQATDGDTGRQDQDQQQPSQPQAQQTEQADATSQAEGTDQNQEQGGESDNERQPPSRQGSNTPARRRSGRPTYYYDPQAAARTGLLQLATAWKDAGSTYQAMNAYMEILSRYPQSGTAAAATEGLVDLARKLEKQGMFYAALSIYQKLETAL